MNELEVGDYVEYCGYICRIEEYYEVDSIYVIAPLDSCLGFIVPNSDTELKKISKLRRMFLE